MKWRVAPLTLVIGFGDRRDLERVNGIITLCALFPRSDVPVIVDKP